MDLEDVQAGLEESSSKGGVGAAGVAPEVGWGEGALPQEEWPWGTPPTSSLGGGNSIFLSMRPGRSRAESRMSIRFVAMITCTGRTTVTTPATPGPAPSPGRAGALLP